ncbi:MAG: succinate dehydrogenase, cytochrome b556 subunit [Alphaproteobacteria bacterium]|nr:succinate dehydrogenase, cytochrome b556 subunit [Alphaproteobacteria bacterium]
MSSPAEAKTAAPKARPLSPHLQIYKPQITTTLSILHRIAGIVLSFGILVFTVWLAALASGPESYASFTSCAQSIVGQIVLFGISLAFFFHLCSGIRHLLWDSGKFMEIEQVYRTGYIVIGASLLLTLIVWLKVYGVSL